MATQLDRSAPLIYLRVLPDGDGGPALRVDLGNRLKGIRYEDEDAKADTLTLTLDNRDLELTDDPAFKEGMELEVAWGYPGFMTPTRKCVITGIEGGLVITATAHAKSILLNTEEKTRTFQNVRRSDVARQLAQEAGYGREAQVIDETAIVYPSISQVRMTDAQFLRKLADKEGFAFYVDYEGFHFHQRRLGQAPVHVLTYYTDLSGEILDFRLETKKAGKKGRTVVKGRDPLERKDYSAVADNRSDSGRETLGEVVELVDPEEGRTRLDRRLGSQEVRPTAAGDSASAQKEAQARFRREQQSAVKLEFDVIGLPGYLAKTVVEVRGLGRRFSGRYYLRKVETTIAQGAGYKVVLHGVSDGTGGHSTESKVAQGVELVDVGVRTAGKKNNEKPKEQGAEGEELEAYEEADPEQGVTRIRYRKKG